MDPLCITIVLRRNEESDSKHTETINISRVYGKERVSELLLFISIVTIYNYCYYL